MTRANHRTPPRCEPRPYSQRELMLKAEAIQLYARANEARLKWAQEHGPYIYVAAPLKNVTTHAASAQRARELLEIAVRREQD